MSSSDLVDQFAAGVEGAIGVDGLAARVEHGAWTGGRDRVRARSRCDAMAFDPRDDLDVTTTRRRATDGEGGNFNGAEMHVETSASMGDLVGGDASNAVTQNSSFGSLSESLGQENGQQNGSNASLTEGGLDDFGDFATEPAAVESAPVESAPVESAPVESAPAESASAALAGPESTSASQPPSAPVSNVGSMQALSESDFAPLEPAIASEPALNTLNSPHLQAFRAKQAELLAEREEVERREIERIKEEAKAELDLMDSQRAKQISAAKQANRERQTAEEELFANSTGWEAVCNYVSEENLVPNSLTDLSKMRSLLRTLKNTHPVKTA